MIGERSRRATSWSDLVTSLVLRWDKTMTAHCANTFINFHHCLALRPRSDVWSAAVNQQVSSNSHALVNTRTKKRSNKGHLLLHLVRRLGAGRIQWSFHVYFTHSNQILVLTGMRRKVLINGFLPGASVTCLIDIVLWIPCFSMASLFGWTIMKANGRIFLAISLLYLFDASLLALAAEETTSKCKSLLIIEADFSVEELQTFAFYFCLYQFC